MSSQPIPYGPLPPYPGTPQFTAGRDFNPERGNLMTTPYLNGLLGTVDRTQDFLYQQRGLQIPPYMPSAPMPPWAPWPPSGRGNAPPPLSPYPGISGLPPYPGTPQFNRNYNFDPAYGDYMTTPYLNGLFHAVNQHQNFLYRDAGVGYSA